MNKLYLCCLAGCVFILGATPSSFAGIVTFEYYAVAQSGSTNPVSAGPVAYDIYLMENLNGNPELANTLGGLIGGGFYVGISGTGTTTITGVSANTAAFGNQAGTTYRQNSTTEARLIENALGNAVQFSQVDSQHYNVKLGTVTLNAVSGSTTFNVKPYKYSSNIGGTSSNGTTLASPDFVLFYDLDVTNNTEQGGGATYTGANDALFNSFTVTVASAGVPEPSSMILCGLAAAAGFGAYRRRAAKSVALQATTGA